MSKLITRIKRLALALCFVTPLVSWAAEVGDTVTWTNADGLSADNVVNANHCSFSLQLPETAGLAKGSVVRITNVQIASINSQRVSNSSNNQNDPHSIAIGATRSSEVSFITSETLAGKYIDSYDFTNGVEVEVGKKYGESWGAYYTNFSGCGITFLHSNGNRWSGGTTMNCTVGGTTSGAIANGTTVFPIYKITATVVAVAQNVERTIAANDDTTWVAEAWTVGGVADQSFEPDSDTIYNVTVTVGGDCTVTMPESIGSFRTCNINFVLDGSAEAANVTLKYSGTLPSDSATTANFSPFGAANVAAGEGVTLTPTYDGDTEGYVTKVEGVNYYFAKRSDVGVVSVRIGARTAEAAGGNIDPSYSNVGPYPLSGMLWNQTKLWNNNSTSGTYTDIQNLKDAKDGSSSVRIAYYGHNTYLNNNAATSPNMVLTKTYLDDSDSGNGDLTATDGEEEITLPTPGHVRGWQLHFDNIPYNAYDVYFITASDVVNGSLKETPIYVSLDGGSTWKSYCGDSVNEKTVMGTDNWTGLPYAENGVLVHGKNYIKMRITKSIYGDNIGTIDITHGVRNTGSSIRSGLAAIQIVEVQNDGVYTLQESGNWSDAVWSVGSLTDQTWTDTVEGDASIAKIASSETVASVNVDTAVSAGSVVLTGSDPFTVAGSSTLTVDTGFDASAFTGSLNLQAPITGTIYIGANTDLEFGGDTDMTLPAYTLDGAGAWQKVGSGKLTVNSPLALAGTVNAGTVEFTSSTSGSLSLVGGDLVLAGGETELIYSGVASLADQGSGKTVVASGVVQSTGRIETDIDVEDGAKLKLGALRGFGSGGASVGSTPSGKTITIKEGGTIELNGTEGCNEYTLAGGTLQNSGNAIAVTQRQTMGLTLTDDSTVNAASNFGLVNNGYAAVTVTLNGKTLTKTGANTFILCNVSTDNNGAIEVAEGTMSFQGSASTLSVPVTVAQDAALNVAVASTVSSVDGEGSVTGSATLTVNDQLDLTDGLTVAAPVALADGATVTFAYASTITGTIASPASGTATLDVSAITATSPAADITLATAATGLDVTKLALTGAPEKSTLKVVDGVLTLKLPVAITVPVVANTTVTVTVGGATVEPDTEGGNVFTVEAGSAVVVTYTVDPESYSITDGMIEITATEDVTVPEPTVSAYKAIYDGVKYTGVIDALNIAYVARPTNFGKVITVLDSEWEDPGTYSDYFAWDATERTYTVITYPARIAATYYPSLKAAVAAASADATIVLVADDMVSFANVVVTAKVPSNGSIVIDKNITIDGAGFTVYGNTNAEIMNATGSSTPGYDMVADLVDGSNLLGFFVKSGNVTFTNITLTEFGDTAYVNKFGYTPIQTASAYTGTLTLTNVDFSKFNRTAVCVRGGTLSMTGGTISGGTVNKNNGDYFQQPVEVRGGTATISGVTINGGDDIAGNGGGAIVAWAPTTVNNVEIDFVGYGIWSDGPAVTVTGEDTVVVADTALFAEEGGTITVAAGDFTGALAVDSDPSSGISLSGGTFDSDVNEFCAEDYLADNNGDGTFTVRAANWVAQITGGAKFESVTAALEAAETGDTVVVLVNTHERVYAAVNNNVTLDINGKTMTSPVDDVIIQNGTGTLTIKDTAVTPGLVQSTINGVDLGVAVWARQGTVVVQSGVFENNSNYEATLYVSNGAYARVEGGTFRNVAEGAYQWKKTWAPVTLNVQNGHADGAAAITVTGGNFTTNPANGDDSFGGTFVDDSCISEDNGDGTFTVRAATWVAQITGGAKFETVKAALEAAETGDTVVVLANTHERVYAAVNNNVTLDINGKTMTSPVDDVIIQNGTGTLTIKDTAATPGLVQSTINGVDLGVAVWARQGTVVVQSGVFENNSNYEATLYVSNGAYARVEGGTFRNVAEGAYQWKKTWAPVTLNVQNGHADGAAAITVTGGNFTTNPANGDDSFGGTFVASGYAATEDNGVWTVAEKTGIDPTDPESKQEVTPSEQEIADAGSAEAAAKAKATVTVPEAVATATGVTEETYKSYFTLSATETAPGSGVYDVAIVELNEDVVFPTSESDDLTADLADVLDVAAGADVEITTAKPGLYYSIEAADNVGFTGEGTVEGERELATTTTVSPAKPAKTGNAVFYRVKVSTTQE